MDQVAPLAGAWIEIYLSIASYMTPASLPSRERGLKSLTVPFLEQLGCVAPLAGAWIEIDCLAGICPVVPVAPLAGAWIEMGLKSIERFLQRVAPLAGAWIEMWHSSHSGVSCRRRSPRGSVD